MGIEIYRSCQATIKIRLEGRCDSWRHYAWNYQIDWKIIVNVLSLLCNSNAQWGR